MVAKKAMKDIEESEEHLASCIETQIRNTEDVQTLIDRIEEIVCEKPSGMFTNGIIIEYKSKYNEILPENWIQLLQESSVLEIEELDGRFNKFPKWATHIVRKAKFSSGSTTPSSTSEFEKLDIAYEESGITRTIVRKDQIPDIPPLTIPFGNEWGVYVNDISQTIAVRLVDYDQEFLNMEEEMKNFYLSESLPAMEISEGLLYVVHLTESDTFCRVLVQTVKDDLAECYFVDEGKVQTFSTSDLQELHLSFWKLPFQAIHMTLDGFENYPLNPTKLTCLLKKTLIAVVKRGEPAAFVFLPDHSAVHKVIYSVVLYDTETDAEEDINLNEIFKHEVIESEIPNLPKPGNSASFFLTHVENSGEIYLRKIPPLESWLETSLENLSPIFEKECLEKVTIPLEKICVAKYEDSKWYRATLLQNSKTLNNPDYVEVFFVDFGNTSIIPINEVCQLENISDFLFQLAPQAIKCELFDALPSPDVEWTTEATKKLVDLAPFNQELFIRVIKEEDNFSLAKVSLHKRIYQNADSFFISINASLSSEPELFKISSLNPKPSLQDSFSTSIFPNDIQPPVPRPTLSTLNNISSDSFTSPIMPPNSVNGFKWITTPENIKSPDALEEYDPPPIKLLEDIPNKGQLFDILVTMAANPHKFYVQPLASQTQIKELLEQMDQFYSSEENLVDIHLSLLKENNFYAVKHKDGHWYRAQLQKVINTDPVEVVVRYVDYGDIVTVRMQQLQILYGKFRHLPCQCITASLAGVKPIDKDWDHMHVLKFRDLVQRKQFVSVIQNKQLTKDVSMPVLELDLTLIDVSHPEKDVYIHELLIDKGIAAQC